MDNFTQLNQTTFVSNNILTLNDVNFKLVLHCYIHQETKVNVTYSVMLVVEYNQLHQEHKTLTEEQYYIDRLFELASFLVKRKKKTYNTQKEVEIESVFNSMVENLPSLQQKVSSSKAKKRIRYLLLNED